MAEEESKKKETSVEKTKLEAQVEPDIEVKEGVSEVKSVEGPKIKIIEENGCSVTEKKLETIQKILSMEEKKEPPFGEGVQIVNEDSEPLKAGPAPEASKEEKVVESPAETPSEENKEGWKKYSNHLIVVVAVLVIIVFVFKLNSFTGAAVQEVPKESVIEEPVEIEEVPEEGEESVKEMIERLSRESGLESEDDFDEELEKIKGSEKELVEEDASEEASNKLSDYFTKKLSLDEDVEEATPVESEIDEELAKIDGNNEESSNKFDPEGALNNLKDKFLSSLSRLLD